MDRKAIAAIILGCEPQELRNFRDYGTFVSVIDLVGHKFIYTSEHLAEAESASKEQRVPAPAPAPAKPAKKSEPGGPAAAKKIAKPLAKKTVPVASAAAKKIAKKQTARKSAGSAAVKASTGK